MLSSYWAEEWYGFYHLPHCSRDLRNTERLQEWQLRILKFNWLHSGDSQSTCRFFSFPTSSPLCSNKTEVNPRHRKVQKFAWGKKAISSLRLHDTINTFHQTWLQLINSMTQESVVERETIRCSEWKESGHWQLLNPQHDLHLFSTLGTGKEIQ